MTTNENCVARCAIIGMAAAFLAVPVHTQAAQRTFVSTGGNDLDACSLAAPCRGFARAITQTDVGGEIVALDSGGYGSVTVNKNVSIISPAGVYAGISVFAATDGVTVIAPATKVVLRGLSINGQLGNNGIRVQAGEVHIAAKGLPDSIGIARSGAPMRLGGTDRLRDPVDLKRWLLWASLALGALLLGWMAWRLSRDMGSASVADSESPDKL